MSFVAAAIVGGAVVGAVVQSDAARRAANSQRGAANEANALQWNMYEQQRQDNEPFRQAGIQGLEELKSNKFMDNWQQDPGYEFRMKEGEKALNAAAAARGLNNSGATLKALTKYGQDYSSNEYSNVYNRNMQRINGLLGLGSSANSQNNQNSTNVGNNVSNNIMSSGNAQAAGQIATGNAYAGALQNGVNGWMNYQMMNRAFNSGNAPRITYNAGPMNTSYNPNLAYTGYLGTNTNFGG